jgi:hypothetical protein
MKSTYKAKQFLVEEDSQTIMVSGTTDKTIDLAIRPVKRTYRLSPRAAIALAKVLKASADDVKKNCK